MEGFYYKPRVDKEILRKYHEGIIALSACLAGEVQRYMHARNVRGSMQDLPASIEEIFGKGNFFLELQDHGHAGTEAGESGAASHEQGDWELNWWQPMMCIIPMRRM